MLQGPYFAIYITLSAQMFNGRFLLHPNCQRIEVNDYCLEGGSFVSSSITNRLLF